MFFSLSCSVEEASKMIRVILYWYTRQAECHVEIPACFRFNLSFTVFKHFYLYILQSLVII